MDDGPLGGPNQGIPIAADATGAMSRWSSFWNFSYALPTIATQILHPGALLGGCWAKKLVS